jgi:hypothetical protein
MNASFSNAGSSADPNLIAGAFPRVDRKLTVLTGQTLAAGTVLALDGAGKAVPVDSGTPSIQNPVAILAHDVDTTGGDREAIAYYAGEFNEAALTFGGSDTADTHRDALRRLGIYLTNNVGA